MAIERMKTDSFFLTIGVTPGYYHGNELARTDFVGSVARIWQELMEADGGANGTYVSAVASPASAVYHRQWGCPEGGEQVVAFTATRNPNYNPDSDAWKQAVVHIVDQLRQRLQQETCQLEFREVEMVYFDFRKSRPTT